MPSKQGSSCAGADARARSTGRPLAGYTGALCALGAAAAIGLTIGAPAQAAFPGLNGRLACEGQRGDPLPDPPAGQSRTEVFTVNPDGSDELVLTNNRVRDGDPGWSPDGRFLTYESFIDGFSEVYKMTAAGGGLTRLTTSGNNEDRSTSWSPDGTKIAFHSTRDDLPPGAPAGSSKFEIYVMDADGGNQVRLTNNLSQDTFPAWSPDGSRLAFLSNRDLDFEIYTMKPDGTDVQRLTASSGEDAHPSWSPDGTQIAFHSRRDSPAGGVALEIYRMNADGSNQTRVTTGDGFKYFPIWSPDGKRIAFNGNLDATDSSNTDVYHVDALDGSDPVRVTTAAGFDGRCDWLALPLPAPPAVTPVRPSRRRW